jgi:hypothetical protein
MQVFGIDFTSRPMQQKPLTCLSCIFENGTLQTKTLKKWYQFSEFESAMNNPGPWIAGIDFPFGQSRKFITNIGWPETWRGYVCYAQSLGDTEFYNALTAAAVHIKTKSIAARLMKPRNR